MKDHEVSELLDRLAASVQPGPAPVPALMVRRSRRGLAVMAGATVVAAVVATVVIATASWPRGGQPRPKQPFPPVVVEPGAVVLVGQGLVLEDRSHGPQLCVGGVETSSPPQCSGPDIPNWDWAAVEGEATRSGTTDGVYVVTGTFDADAFTFTLTRPAVTPEEYDGPAIPEPYDGDPLGTPCEAPAGGWKVVDPALTTEATFQDTADHARQMEGYAGLWLDQSGSTQPNDPTQFVLNVAVTTDLREAEAELRRTWGGALCVTYANWTERQLRRMQSRAFELAGQQRISASSGRDVVTLEVVYDPGRLQEELDDEFGPGVAVVRSALRPAESERVSLELGHCFVDPVEYDGGSWGLPLARQFGWGGLMPARWAGQGSISRVGPRTVRYLDDEGVALLMLPTDDPSVREVEDQLCR